MKRSIFCAVALLTCSSMSLASPGFDYERQTVQPAGRIQTTPGFLGVELSEVNKETVQRLKLREERGALVESVTSGSGAAEAGLQKDDVIVKWEGERIESARELARHIRETPAGRTVRLGVLREGREMDINVKIGERLAAVARVRAARPIVRTAVRTAVARERVRIRDRARLGAELQGMTDQLAEYFGLSKRTGALVVFVFADSPAAKAGLKAGDVILSMGGEKVENPADLRRTLESKSEGPIELRVLRDKKEHTLKVQLEKGSTSWVLEPEDADEVVVGSQTAPMTVRVPRVKVASAAIAMPRISVTPLVLDLPRIEIAPMALPSMKIDLQPMRVEVPAIKIGPMRVVVAPRRIIL